MLLPQLWSFGSREFALSALKSHFFHVFLLQSSRTLFSLVVVSQELVPAAAVGSAVEDEHLFFLLQLTVGGEARCCPVGYGAARPGLLWWDPQAGAVVGGTVAVPCGTWGGCA